MDVKEARRIWGSDVPQDVLEEWITAYNKRTSADPPDVPKGANSATGKAIPSKNY